MGRKKALSADEQIEMLTKLARVERDINALQQQCNDAVSRLRGVVNEICLLIYPTEDD